MRSIARGLWRLFQPVRYTHGIRPRVRLTARYARYFADWRKYKAAGGNAPFQLLSPKLTDADPASQSGAGHYFYQDIWALRRLAAFAPAEHHDVGSRFDGFVGQATAVCKVVCWEIRPPAFALPDFEFRRGDLLDLPLADGSVRSLSSLHVVEHVGLGRYGDPLDPDGTAKAIRQLGRLLAPGGQLLFGVPVGRERVEFNAQRVLDPRHPPALLADLTLAEFSVVDDADRYVEYTTPDRYAEATYACGLYRFVRPPVAGS